MAETGGSWATADAVTRRRAQWKTTFNGSGSEIDALDLIYKTTPSSLYAFTSSNANDSVGSNNLTENGTPTYSNSGAVDGNYIIFNGSSQYLTAASSSVFDITTQDFTFCGYIYRTSDSGAVEQIISKETALSVGYHVQIDANDKLNIQVYDGTNSANATTTTSIATNTWYFWAASFTRTGNAVLHLFTVSSGAYESVSASITSVGTLTNAATFTIGRNAAGSSFYFPGRMDSIRYYPYALSTLQVQALFSTYGRYAFNGGVTDSSGNGYDLTANGSPTYGIDNGIYGQYIILNGSSQYLTASANTVFDVTTQDFSLWGYFNLTDTTNEPIAFKMSHTSVTAPGYAVFVSSGNLLGRLCDGSASRIEVTLSTTISTGVWYFWAATFDRDGSLTLHLYNLSTGAYSSTTGAISAQPATITTTQTFTVGKTSANNDAYLAGNMDHLNVLIGTALTTQNVKDLISTLHGGQIAECHGTGSGFTTGITYRRNMENTAWGQLIDADSTQTMTGAKTMNALTLGGNLAGGTYEVTNIGGVSGKATNTSLSIYGKADAAQRDVDVLTPDSGGTLRQRMVFKSNAAQGSAGITLYEPFDNVDFLPQQIRIGGMLVSSNPVAVSANWVQTVTSTGSHSFGYTSSANIITIATGATSGSTAETIWSFGNGDRAAAGSFFQCVAQLTSQTNQRVAIGVFTGSPTADTIAGYGFRITDNGNIFAINGDGASSTTTDTSVTGSGYKTLCAIYTGSSIKFYINGTLKATHTTNLPSAATGVEFRHYITNSAAADKGSVLACPVTVGVT